MNFPPLLGAYLTVHHALVHCDLHHRMSELMSFTPRDRPGVGLHMPSKLHSGAQIDTKWSFDLRGNFQLSVTGSRSRPVAAPPGARAARPRRPGAARGSGPAGRRSRSGPPAGPAARPGSSGCRGRTPGAGVARARSSRSGSANRAGSRLADSSETSTGSPGRDRHAAELDRLGGEPEGRGLHRGLEAQELLDRAGQQRRVGAQPGQLGPGGSAAA